ncbi:MAG: FKBP-type peptidyl-prolyl cis-trans isomerase [Bacteroidales bacterium]|nr:FKBP-type peptidyl-prolyl cis-trans isomerase [Bacteroidales bacterium]MCF8391674.1 FKBP-type peptidyl-prolyl cis-trans isomerase [Bacteroidales bacterium]
MILIVAFLVSCKQIKEGEPVQILDEKQVTNALIEVNRSIVKRNRDHIHNFVRRTGWELEEIESGIWFGILTEGKGNKPSENDQVEFNYIIRLIDGSYPGNISKAFTSDIILGKGSVESGLEMGLKRMREGDSARIIIPPYFTQGDFENREGIPPGAILIFDVKLLKAK